MTERTAPDGAAGSIRQRRRVLLWILAGAIAVVGTVGIISVNQQNARAQAEQDATEPTAWENRLAMDEVMVDRDRRRYQQRAAP